MKRCVHRVFFAIVSYNFNASFKNVTYIKESEMNNTILTHLLKKLDQPDLIEKLSGSLSLSELNSLLMEVFRRKSLSVSPARLIENYRHNRYSNRIAK